MTRLDRNFFDYGILFIYFALVVAIGVLARRAVATSEDFLLSGRALPAWVTGLAFISANLGAIEILGMAANGMLVLGLLFLLWVRLAPLQPLEAHPTGMRSDEDDDSPHQMH